MALPHPAPLPGRLHTYNTKRNLSCFESGDLSGQNALVFIGGLSSGLNAIPAIPKLSAALPSQWSLFQVILRSSYDGYLNGSIDNDAEDIAALEQYLRKADVKPGRLVILGHSTGTQDIVRFFQLYGETTTFDSAILLAPVSDREYIEFSSKPEEVAASLRAASAQIGAGQGHLPLPPDIQELPVVGGCKGISADRWHSLATVGGHEDYFSYSHSDETFARIFEGVRKAEKEICILVGEKDPCIRPDIDKHSLLQRLEKAAGSSCKSKHSQVVPGANHCVEDEDAIGRLVTIVVDFIESGRPES